MKTSKRSLKLIILSLIFLCWLIPMILMTGVMGYYVLSRQEDNRLMRMTEQMEANNRICQERLDGAITDSRRISYDKTVRDKYEQYKSSLIPYSSLYSEVQYYLSVEFGRKKAVAFTIVTMGEDEEMMSFNVVNSSAGGSYQGILDFWDKDVERVQEYAKGLDTAIGFVQEEGRLYLVRNMVNSRFKTWGTIILRLNKDYCFEMLLAGQENVGIAIDLNGENVFLERMETVKLPELSYDYKGAYQVEQGKIFITHKIKSSDYTLKTLMVEEKDASLTPLYGYQYVLIGMVAFLVPLCILMLSVFKRQVSRPIEDMMESAHEIEKGNLGYQMEKMAGTQEFQYLEESFNHMSRQLKYQFDHIYQEELALKDARIMALQSHINPHFMNNTLEIINWEARMNGDIKVSEMIGALGTLLDAAMDRRKQPEVRLSEELTYVNAYLYIMRERFGKRLQVTKEIPEEILDYRVPRLILQPVIENAIEHGITPKGNGRVTLSGYVEGEYLILKVVNDGTMTAEDEARISRLLQPDYNASRESSGNLGIANVNQRLQILYGKESGLTIKKQGQDQVVALLCIKFGQKAKEIQEMAD